MSDEDEYEIPLQDQRIFGAGIKRKRVKFVPSTEASSGAPTTNATPARSVSELYLGLVLPGDSHKDENNSSNPLPDVAIAGPETGSADLRSEAYKTSVCEICNLPLSSLAGEDTESSPSDRNPAPRPRPHEASLAHQVCLTHSHPPSHLDRNRKGLAYLSAYGWDPDSRLGLGAAGQGIQFPIKTKPKDDKLGIGVILPVEADRRKKEKPTKLDAGKVRKMHEKDRKKAERLREMFYRNDDVERYLGGG